MESTIRNDSLSPKKTHTVSQEFIDDALGAWDEEQDWEIEERKKRAKFAKEIGARPWQGFRDNGKPKQPAPSKDRFKKGLEAFLNGGLVQSACAEIAVPPAHVPDPVPEPTPAAESAPASPPNIAETVKRAIEETRSQVRVVTAKQYGQATKLQVGSEIFNMGLTKHSVINNCASIRIE